MSGAWVIAAVSFALLVAYHLFVGRELAKLKRAHNRAMAESKARSEEYDEWLAAMWKAEKP